MKKVDIDDDYSSLETKPHMAPIFHIHACLADKLAKKLKVKDKLFVPVDWRPIFRLCNKKWWTV